jgi:hypothetical protein
METTEGMAVVVLGVITMIRMLLALAAAAAAAAALLAGLLEVTHLGILSAERVLVAL